jgi:hypothetical protein
MGAENLSQQGSYQRVDRNTVTFTDCDFNHNCCQVTEEVVGIKMVYKPGTWVLIGDDVPGLILQVCINRENVEYEVVWWEGRVRKKEWLCDIEVKLKDDSDYIGVGFITPETKK